MPDLLDNIAWFALTGPQSCFATGDDSARRFAAGFSPILGFNQPQQPDFAALARLCDVGEHLYCAEWTGPVPDDWCLHVEKQAFRMIWDGTSPPTDIFSEAVPLGPQHAAQALELAQLTNPGPFGIRTIELGDYFGWFEDSRLVSMAGERMHAGDYREVSGICTHPDFRGRGLARRLTLKMIYRLIQRGEMPILHVMADNIAALQLYREMGFRVYCETTLRIISRY